MGSKSTKNYSYQDLMLVDQKCLSSLTITNLPKGVINIIMDYFWKKKLLLSSKSLDPMGFQQIIVVLVLCIMGEIMILR